MYTLMLTNKQAQTLQSLCTMHITGEDKWVVDASKGGGRSYTAQSNKFACLARISMNRLQ